MSTELLKREKIIGSRRIDNYFWACILFIGGTGFILASFSSYYKIQLFPFNGNQWLELNFIPQGILMLAYGTLALFVCLYIIFTIIWDLGGGYNEFDKANSTIRIVRKGFPGKDSNILLNYSFDEIKSIDIVITEGINPKRALYLATTDGRRIPITAVGQPLPISELEEKAIKLAKFLDVQYNILR